MSKLRRGEGPAAKPRPSEAAASNAKLLNPLDDNLGSSLLTGGKRQAPKPRRPRKEPKEPSVTFAEADEAWRRIRLIYGSQDSATGASVAKQEKPNE